MSNASSGSSLPVEQIRLLGTAFGRLRKRRLRGVHVTREVGISGDWVGFLLLCDAIGADCLW